MLDSIVAFSLRFRGIVVALSCLLLGYGAHVAMNAKLDVFPDFAPPQVVVQTESPGFSPEQVESLVTRPVEAALNGVKDMETLRSESAQGLSVVTVVFREGADIMTTRQMIAEKLGELSGRLPSTVKPPALSPLTSATMDLLKVGLVSEKLPPTELRDLADWTIRPRLLSAPGVARCIVFGGEVRRLQIAVDNTRLRATGLGVADVLAAARAATGVNGSGFVETSAQRIVVASDSSAVTPEALAATPLTTGVGANIRIGDVATVGYASAPKFGDARIMGRPGVMMALAGQYGANTLEVTKAVEAALDEFKPMLAKRGVALYGGLHRPANFIESSLASMGGALATGAVLVAVVLLLFLGNLRVALISLTAIPLSLLTAVLALDRFGVTLNTLTLGGLAIAIGEVVDDAIIDAENIWRRLRDNLASANPRPAAKVVLEASIEVRGAVVYATFIVVLVFLPVLMLTGIQGKFFAPLALSYILAILASLAVALTLTPALALLFFSRKAEVVRESRVQSSLKSAYARLVSAVVVRPGRMLAAVGVLCVPVAFILPDVGGELLPAFREGHFVVQVCGAPGTSLAESARLGGIITAEFLKIDGVDTVEQQIGRAEQGEDPFGPEKCELHVELKHAPGVDDREVGEKLRGVLARIPGIQSEVLTFLGDRIGETVTGETASVVVNIFGDDLDVLDAKAAEVKKVLSGVAGSTDVRVKSSPGALRLTVKLRHDRLALFGVRPQEVMEVVGAACQGMIIGQSCDGARVADIAVTLEGPYRNDPGALAGLTVGTPKGGHVPLRELADIALSSGRGNILHEGARRRQTVTCNASGVDLETFGAAAKRAVDGKVKFPVGCYAEFSGEAVAGEAALKELLLHTGMAVVGIVMLLLVVTRRWRNAALILLNLPFALVGGVVGLWLAGHFLGEDIASLSLGSAVGFVTLFGITTRNSIMLVSHYEHLVRAEGSAWCAATAVRGAAERLVPILMTALVTGIGLVPLVLGARQAGREIEGPMAIVILGGLVSSTLLNLLVLPALALRFGRFEKACEAGE